MTELLTLVKSAGDIPFSIGVLGIFAWYTMTNNREWRSYLSERNGKVEKAFNLYAQQAEELSKTLERNNKVMIRHLLDNGGNEADINDLSQ